MRRQQQRDGAAGDGRRLAGARSAEQPPVQVRRALGRREQRAGREQPQHGHAAGHQVGLGHPVDAAGTAERRRTPFRQVRGADRERLRVEAGVTEPSRLVAGRHHDGDAGVVHPLDGVGQRVGAVERERPLARQGQVDDVDPAVVRGDPLQSGEDLGQTGRTVRPGHLDHQHRGARRDPEGPAVGRGDGSPGDEVGHEGAMAVAVVEDPRGDHARPTSEAGGVDGVHEVTTGTREGGGVGHAGVHHGDTDPGARAGGSGTAAEPLRGEYSTVAGQLLAGQLHRVVGCEAPHAPRPDQPGQRRAVTAHDRDVKGRQEGDDPNAGHGGQRPVVRRDGLCGGPGRRDRCGGGGEGAQAGRGQQQPRRSGRDGARVADGAGLTTAHGTSWGRHTPVCRQPDRPTAAWRGAVSRTEQCGWRTAPARRRATGGLA